MCSTCGCSKGTEARLTIFASEHEPAPDHLHPYGEPPRHPHENPHDHPHEHAHGHSEHEHQHGGDHEHLSETQTSRTLRLEQDILARNNRLAERNRGWFEGREILAFNLMSSPGAGKTALLERTIRELCQEVPICVIEGDQETTRDAERIRATGCRALQINTGSGCHLDAEMLASALRKLDPPRGSILMIENVGNLVCPAIFDLGERKRIVIASVTEGDDKPLKYPQMFRAADIMILNKVDLLPHVPFDVDRSIAYALQVNPKLRVLQLSVLRGDGMAEWYSCVREEISLHKAAS